MTTGPGEKLAMTLREGRRRRRKGDRSEERAPARRLFWPDNNQSLRHEMLRFWCDTCVRLRPRIKAAGLACALVMHARFHSRTGAYFRSDDTAAAEVGCHPRRIAEGKAALLQAGLLVREWDSPRKGQSKTAIFYPSLPLWIIEEEVRKNAGCPQSQPSRENADRPHSARDGKIAECPLSTASGSVNPGTGTADCPQFHENADWPLPENADCPPHIKEVSKKKGFSGKDSLTSGDTGAREGKPEEVDVAAITPSPLAVPKQGAFAKSKLAELVSRAVLGDENLAYGQALAERMPSASMLEAELRTVGLTGGLLATLQTEAAAAAGARP